MVSRQNRARARVLVGLLYLIIALLEDIVDCARTTVRTHIGCALHDAMGFRVIREYIQAQKWVLPHVFNNCGHWSAQSCLLAVLLLKIISWTSIHLRTLSMGKLGVLNPNPKSKVT